MDILRLVDRIAAAMGPDADPARVEAVAAAVLDVTSPRSASGGDRILITAFGLDRQGILAGITNTVSGAGCNIVDVSQKILQEYFTLIMIAEIATMRISLAELQRQLTVAGEALGVRVRAQHEDLFAEMHRP